jgi:hypothetical protein
MWLNTLPTKSGVSTTMRPQKLVTCHHVDFRKHCHVCFGSFIEAYEDADVSNNLHDCTLECIALGLTRNLQGSIVCLDLDIRYVIKYCTFTPLPIPDQVIKHIIHWGKKSTQAQSEDIT